jgi:hypothetical protein
VILLKVSFQSVLVAEFLFGNTAFNMFPASVAHIWEMVSVLMNLNDTLGGTSGKTYSVMCNLLWAISPTVTSHNTDYTT